MAQIDWGFIESRNLG